MSIASARGEEPMKRPIPCGNSRLTSPEKEASIGVWPTPPGCAPGATRSGRGMTNTNPSHYAR